MADRLRVELTANERGLRDVVAITFHHLPAGSVIIREEWSSHDELRANGVSIDIPPRIWAEGIKWLAEGAKSPNPLPTPGGT